MVVSFFTFFLSLVFCVRVERCCFFVSLSVSYLKFLLILVCRYVVMSLCRVTKS